MKKEYRMELTKEERSEKVLKKKKTNPLSKRLVKEGDTMIGDTFVIFKHGQELNARSNFNLSYNDTDKFMHEVEEYIKFSSEKRLTPTLLGCALWLGVDSATMRTWVNDSAHHLHNVAKTSSEYFHNYLQQKALDSELNPLMYFFMSKNYWGMQDKTEIVHRSQHTQVIDLSDQQRIINSAPGVVVDVEYTEKSETKEEELDNEQLETLLRGNTNESDSLSDL